MVVSKPPAGMPMMADDVLRRLRSTSARSSLRSGGGHGRSVRRAMVIREESRARRDADSARFPRSIGPTPGDERRSGVTASHTAGFLARETRGTETAARGRSRSATGARPEKTYLGTRRRVLDDARVSCTRREVVRDETRPRRRGADDDDDGKCCLRRDSAVDTRLTTRETIIFKNSSKTSPAYDEKRLRLPAK